MLFYICVSGTLTKNTKKFRKKKLHNAMMEGGSSQQGRGIVLKDSLCQYNITHMNDSVITMQEKGGRVTRSTRPNFSQSYSRIALIYQSFYSRTIAVRL